MSLTPYGELDLIEELRPELLGYCYRMTGSLFEAEDALQEARIRVWRHRDQLRTEEARRAWIYRIVTNICLDRLRSAKRRALPMDLSESAAQIAEPRDTLPAEAWIWPAPASLGDPLNIVLDKETLRLSFLALLQRLPPRQRAALILQDVFRWPAAEAAEALGMTKAAVGSALQRARASLAGTELRSESLRNLDNDADRELLDRYVEAFEAYDIDALLTLFHEQAGLSMPPFVMWVSGRSSIASFYEAVRRHCTGSRLLRIRANGGCPAFAHYVPAGEGGPLTPWSIQIPEIRERRIVHLHHFIDAALFERFVLPRTDEFPAP
ncbi:RNA polymerase subunit sigma-70 [Saccharibacillus sp. CPCC 101409]|uniref:RNA polymerase subunit sigma-70 n=1 Tax=Saccharibacillus sp. CPCC 101409 TaxID=3058041 RepID=UPI0026710FD2|nr:RNA polymerase subunit sigma-70 [Saccharibacillus sp. CPCC 101409]MDO3412584.1 RNA polymerase subunit sigma-70 [Saccharibacillus sp. CPCC 101409]